MLKSLFNKVAGLRPATLLKRDSNICKILRTPILWRTSANDCFSPEVRTSKNNFSYRTPPVAASH